MRITEGSRTVFDTDDKLFHVISTLNGTVGPYFYSGGDNVSLGVDDSITLGSVNPVCTQVIGAIKFTLNNYAAGFAFDRWQMMMGGTAVWVMDGEPGFSDRLGSNFGCAQYVAYSFTTSGGTVRLNRRVHLAGIPFQFIVRPHAITYKLRCGVWV